LIESQRLNVQDSLSGNMKKDKRDQDLVDKAKQAKDKAK